MNLPRKTTKWVEGGGNFVFWPNQLPLGPTTHSSKHGFLLHYYSRHDMLCLQLAKSICLFHNTF